MSTATFTPVAGRFVWKEYRMLRGFWLAVGVLAVLEQCVLMVLAAPGSNLPAWLYGSALAAATLYAAGAAATSFSVEHEEGTYGYLAGLPTHWLPVLVGKALVSLASAVALAAVLVVAGWALAGGRWPAPVDARLLAGMLGMAIVEAVAWGTLFSLLVRRPLVAAMLTLVVGILAVHLAVTTVGHGAIASAELQTYTGALSLRAAIVVAVLAASVLLARRWFSVRTHHPAPTVAALRTAALRAAAPAAGVFASLLTRRRAPRAPRAPMLTRLLWQTWRESRRLLLLPPLASFALFLGFSAAVGLAAQAVSAYVPDIALLSFACAFMLPALFGALAFHADQRRRGYRFLAEHAARPRYVWLARHVVWLGALLAMLIAVAGVATTLVTYTLQQVVNHSLPWNEWLYMSSQGSPYELYRLHTTMRYIVGGSLLVCLAALAAYALGQLCSMLLRSAILAAFLAIVLAVVLAAWTAVLYVWQLNGWVFLLPLAVGLMAATWLRAPAWIADRRSWRGWIGPVLVVAVPLVLFAVVLPAARLAQLPVPRASAADQLDPDEAENAARGARVARELAAHGFPTDRFTPEELETARMYFDSVDIAQSWTEQGIEWDDAPADERAVRDEASRRLQQLRDRDPEGAAFITLEGNRRWREHVEAEARQTAEMYLEIGRRLAATVDNSPIRPWLVEFPNLIIGEEDSEAMRRMIPADRWDDFAEARKQTNALIDGSRRAVLAELIPITGRPTCQFPLQEFGQNFPQYRRLTELASTLPYRAPLPEEQFDYALAALRMCGHLREGQPARAFITQLETERKVLEAIAHWAEGSRTSDELHAATRRLESWFKSRRFKASANPTQSLFADGRIIRDVVRGKQMPVVLGIRPAPPSAYLAWLANELPWERERAQRALDEITATNSGYVSGLMSRLAYPQRYDEVTQWLSYLRPTPTPKWVYERPAAATSWLVRLEYEARVPVFDLCRGLCDTEMYRRATLLRIALIAYRNDHDRYPPRLADLVPDYLESEPLDPYSGSSFQYEPTGLGLPMRHPIAVDGHLLDDFLRPHSPVFWSVGPFNTQLRRTTHRTTQAPDPDNPTVEETTTQSVYELNDRAPWKPMGYVFPLPK